MTTPQWHITDHFFPYPQAVTLMEERVEAIYQGTASEMIWFLQHPPLYTAGTSACVHDLSATHRLPVYQSGRGGQYTYHGPGQRVVYIMLDLRRRGRDIGTFIMQLEDWLIQMLAWFNIRGERRNKRVGVWIDMHRYNRAQGIEAKIAAIGVRVRHWITFHGVSINVHPALHHYDDIIPCGLKGYGVTSFHALGYRVTMSDVDRVLQATWPDVFES